MFDKIILCATNNKLTAGIWRLGKLQSHQIFQSDERGLAGFDLFLKNNGNVKIYLLTDAVEEDYRLETLPHTSGGSRREMVERKLSQVYRGITYRAAHFINRETDKRKDDRFLFAALNNDEFLQSWIQVIEEQHAPLAGVYLLPMISQALVRRMKLMQPHILLSERLSSGLRQSYLHNGRLRISRLTPIPLAAQNQLAFFYVTETEKTKLYLISQRYISRDTVLNMVIPSLDGGSDVICRDIEQELGIESSNLDLVKFAHSIKLDPNMLRDNPELVHMQLLAMGNVPDNLAPPKLTRHHQLNLARQLVNAATAAIILGGLVLAGIYFKQGYDQSQLTRQAMNATQVQEHLYNDVAKDFPSTVIPSNDLKIAVDLEEAVASYTRTPSRMMQTISKALGPQPEIQINRLHWVLTNDVDPKDDDKTQSVAPLPKQAADNAGQPEFVPDPKILYEVAFINGEIKGFTGDYREALENVNKFADQLRADESVARVTVLQGPVNVSSYSSLQGSTADEHTSQQSTALFKIRLRLKPQAESPTVQSQVAPL
jgi:hypothetical protein